MSEKIRLINGNALKKLMIDTLEHIKENPQMNGQEAHLIAGMHMLGEMIDDAETCDPFHVIDDLQTRIAHLDRHGRWTADESTYTEGEAQCSVCKTTFYVDDLYCVGEKAQSELPNYCPHCGAKMDAERKEE